MRRLYGTEDKMSSVIRDPSDADPTRHMINWRAKQVTVVSLTGLYEVGKGFVVGSVLQQIQEEKEATGSAEPLCFIVVDELNRYAPRDGWSPIRERLLKLPNAGVRVEQSSSARSKPRQRSNAALSQPRVPHCRPFGRGRSGTRGVWFPAADVTAAGKILTSGRMIVSQPDIPTPVPVCFPMPAWATRAEEVEMPPPNLKLAKVRRSS